MSELRRVIDKLHSESVDKLRERFLAIDVLGPVLPKDLKWMEANAERYQNLENDAQIIAAIFYEVQHIAYHVGYQEAMRDIAKEIGI